MKFNFNLTIIFILTFLNSCASPLKSANTKSCDYLKNNYSKNSFTIYKNEIVIKQLKLTCYDEYGRNPLGMLMAFNRFKESIYLIKQKKWDVNTAIDKEGNRMVHSGVYFYTNEKGLDNLLALKELGANFKAQNKLKQGVFHNISAVMPRNLELFNFLIAQGGDPKLIDSSGRTPLHEAVIYTDKQNTIVKKLLELGANPNQNLSKYGNDIGGTALNRASFYGYLDTIKILLQYGANINQKDIKGNTALHMAAKSNLIKVTKFLLKNKANKFLKNNDGLLPHELTSSPKVKKLLL